MKKITKVLAALLVNFSLINAMGSQPPPPPPQFVNSEISGPPHLAPLFLTDTNTVTIITQLSFYSPSSVDGKIIVEGTHTVSASEWNNKNLEWKIPAAVFTAGLSAKIWRNQEIFVALKIDNRENEISLSGVDLRFKFFNKSR